ncbi:MAG: nucleotide-binding protein, partial [Spirochaetaceae bacterium]|nr:nucleotide-binding protein [Spirochaetaceae bacterium]
MTYYHFRVIRKSDFEDEVYIADLSYDELIRRAITPYEEGKPIVAGGKTVPMDDLDRLMISKSEENSSQLRQQVRASDSNSSVIRMSGPSIAWRALGYATNITDELIVGPPGNSQSERVPDKTTQSRREGASAIGRAPIVADPRKVFVVSGRDTANHSAMFAFLLSLDLHPIEFSEARRMTGRPSPYIGEILDAAFSAAQAIIVLLTPDDMASLKAQFRRENDPPHETEPTGQARPNVLFEAGMAMGHDPDRTVLVEIGQLRPFSDIAGLHIVKFDDSSQIRQGLAQRLEDAGCQVNT